MIRVPGRQSARSVGALEEQQKDPCLPGQELGYDFDEQRERCFASGQCFDFDTAKLTPSDRWVPVRYKGEPFCMSQTDIASGKHPCDTDPNRAPCVADRGMSTGEKVALGVAGAAVLWLGYVALVKDWSKER